MRVIWKRKNRNVLKALWPRCDKLGKERTATERRVRGVSGDVSKSRAGKEGGACKPVVWIKQGPS